MHPPLTGVALKGPIGCKNHLTPLTDPVTTAAIGTALHGGQAGWNEGLSQGAF